jgi:hypothetical protein
VDGGAKKDRVGKGKGEGAKVGYCVDHRQEMKDFGNKWVCDGPPEHVEFKK